MNFGIKFNKFINEKRTPYYVFSEKIIQNQFQKLKNIFQNHWKGAWKIAYSMKNNPLPAAFVVSWQGRMINRWLEKGLCIYKKKEFKNDRKFTCNSKNG